MLQSLREGVMAVDMHGRVTMINHTAREILLLTSGQHSESSSEPLLASLREVSRPALPAVIRRSAVTGGCCSATWSP